MRVLVRRNEAAPLASYIEEILAAEGFLDCETVDVTRRPLTRDLLEGQELVIAAHMPLASVSTTVEVSGGVTPNAKIGWTAAEDPERAGFEILWRETTDPRWTVYDFTTSAGESVLTGVSTDNHFFAVRAVGKNGARSIPVAAQLKPPPPKK